MAIPHSALLTRELAIAAREGLEWELCRVWIREQAIKELRGDGEMKIEAEIPDINRDETAVKRGNAFEVVS